MRVKYCTELMLGFFIENADKLNPSDEVFDALDELQDFVDGKVKKKNEVKEKWQMLEEKLKSS